MRPGRALALVACLLLAAPRSLHAEALEGTVELRLGRRDAPGAEMKDVVVFYRPDAPVTVHPSDQVYEMATIRKGFFPEHLVIPQGSEVRFPNYDPILHNVFSFSGENRFDLGVYGRGDGKRHRFDSAGLVRVFCNVHRSMYAHILVLDTPFIARPDGDGRFRLDGLAPGRGRLGAWHPQTEVVELPVRLPGLSVSIEVDLDRQKIPPHLNKFGRPYARSRRDRY